MMKEKTRSISFIIVCQVAAMTLWFSASAAVPNLIASGHITGQQGSLLTGAVQLGFVAGTLLSAFLGLADKLDPRRLFALSAVLGSSANAAILVTGFDHPATVVLRFVTGMIMAGIYPVGMKMAAGWAERNMGLMIGALVGALTMGSALPHLFTSLSDLNWRITLGTASLCALLAAAGIRFVKLGPRHQGTVRFLPIDAVSALRRRAILLANAGYLGHMWELYAMWAWIGAFLSWGLRASGASAFPVVGDAALMTFIVVASGAIGCLLAGALADRFGRTTITIGAMAASGACAATIGLAVDAGPFFLVFVAVVWGVTVIADSAQFSAAIAELSEPRLVGTMLTIQTCLGFLLTFVAIQLMPMVIGLLTWKYAFTVLAIGPFLGVMAMWRLRQEADALRLANGRR
ncbi:MAG: MFS transporter [Pseudomonadota bacterium]